MFKRRTWKLDRGEEEDSDTDSDSESVSEGEEETDVEATEGRNASRIGYERNEEETDPSSSSEMGSEDDRFDTRNNASNVSSEETKERSLFHEGNRRMTTLGTSKRDRTNEKDASTDQEVEDETESLPLPPEGSWKGKAYRCTICPNVLCLSSQTMQQHLSSKKHRKAMKKAKETRSTMLEAATLKDPEEEAETHAERLQRLKEMNLKHEKDQERRRKVGKGKKGGRQRQKLRAQKKRAKIQGEEIATR